MGRLGITEENYKKYEQAKYNCYIFGNSKECFVCSLIFYLTYLSQAKIFLEVGEISLKGIDIFCDLRDLFKEIVLNASHQDLSEEEEKEISGILSDILTEHLSVSYKLRKKNHGLTRK